MAIRTPTDDDLEAMAALYKQFFPTHNIFSGGDVVTYLTEEAHRHEMLVFDDGAVRGGLFLVKQQSGEHTRWKFRHFAFDDEAAGAELLAEAERRVADASDTAKVELTIAENEPVDFFKKHGYEQEGTLANHYRWGETCYVLSKSFGSF
ncbi:MAG: hypothetical protein ACQESG_07010 [Nanobdellota archaeon]